MHKRRLNIEAVSRPEGLIDLFKAVDTELDALRILANEMRADHATFKAVVDNILSVLTGNVLLTAPGLAIGTTTSQVANVAFDYEIAGTRYTKTETAEGTAPGNDVIPEGTWGAVAFQLGADGTIDAVEATDNATGYASAALALAGLPAVAAAHVRMGSVRVMRSAGDFTFGTTALSDANTTVIYTDEDAKAVSAAPATLSAPSVAESLETLK